MFGYFIDLSMWLLAAFAPGAYPFRIISLLVGCTIIAFGGYFEVVADVVMLPGDAFVRAIAKVDREYRKSIHEKIKRALSDTCPRKMNRMAII